MRLWTWQKKGFDIMNGDTPVRSLENSSYVNEMSSEEERQRFREVYEKLSEKLKPYQYHWYYIEENVAKSEANHNYYSRHSCALWEVNVPDERVFRRVCDVAWNCLLDRLPSSAFWKMKCENEWWDLLFLEEIVEKRCTSVLLRHPLEDSWIEKNPNKEGTWWEIKKGQPPPLCDCSLPCEKCSGRR